MCYVSKDADKYVAKPCTVGVHAATLFEHRQDAKNALDEMRHGTAVLMEIVELSPANASDQATEGAARRSDEAEKPSNSK